MAPAEPEHHPFQILGEVPEFKEELEGWSGYIEWEKVRCLIDGFPDTPAAFAWLC